MSFDVGQASEDVLDRRTGQSLFPIEYRKVPSSDVPGEVAADTQPFPTKPAPFSRQLLTKDMLTTRTPEAHAWALEQFGRMRSEVGAKPSCGT